MNNYLNVSPFQKTFLIKLFAHVKEFVVDVKS